MTIAEDIRRERLRLGLSQRDLANEVGINRTAIQRYENGTRTPNAEMLRKLGDAFGRVQRRESKRTNADMVRGMSDEELVAFLTAVETFAAFREVSGTTSFWRKWLSRPAGWRVGA
jgi:transcriptional regulator with XRE-family HTH domain